MTCECPKPNRIKKRHFTPRDIARIIDKVRMQGDYDDYTIARAVTDSFQITNFLCALIKLFAFLEYIGFITALLMFLKSIKTLLKAIKLLKISPLAKYIEYGIGLFKFTLQYSDVVLYARFLVYVSIAEAIFALMILYVDLFINMLSVFRETNLVCEALNTIGTYQPMAKAFVNMNDDWYGLIENIRQEHNNLQQYHHEIDNLNNAVNTAFPDA